ncbi:hypothetical protein DLM78_21700 [Leptospira stimsonii]|uniref:Uncharacterized protein n=1 Tax=Leptospira stimsonii TaxID=2202203 RepID=A0A8B3CL68_9LEPT|nr:hypothetical protein DLM78_21700 [Leptospira stimsonii]
MVARIATRIYGVTLCSDSILPNDSIDNSNSQDEAFIERKPSHSSSGPRPFRLKPEETRFRMGAEQDAKETSFFRNFLIYNIFNL